MSGPDDGKVKKRPAYLRALGEKDPPEQVTVRGTTYRRGDIVKHDSWAATGIYRSDAGERIVCKFNRTQPAFGVPLRFVGRALAAREQRFLRKLADIALVPTDLGDVTGEGRILPNAIARTYIEGEPLRVQKQMTPRVFAELHELLRAIHARGMAYIDLHKLENVIVDLDGHPHLVDFQVSVGLSDSWPGNGVIARFWLRQLQQLDIYHVNKHIVGNVHQSLSSQQLLELVDVKRPTLIRMHRIFSVPLRALRRRLLVLLRVRGAGGQASSEFEPEDAYRQVPPDRMP